MSHDRSMEMAASMWRRGAGFRAICHALGLSESEGQRSGVYDAIAHTPQGSVGPKYLTFVDWITASVVERGARHKVVRYELGERPAPVEEAGPAEEPDLTIAEMAAQLGRIDREGRRELLLAAVRRCGPLTVKGASELCGIPTETACVVLRDLEKEGRLTSEVADSGRLYAEAAA